MQESSIAKLFYLETNSIRRLGNQLEKYSAISFTSSLSILELIAGAGNDKQFEVRKIAIKNILTSGICIDWRTPLDIVVSAFPVLGSKDDVTGNLKGIAEALTQSKDFDWFKMECDYRKLKLDHFIKLDNELGKRHNLSMEARFRELKEIKNKSEHPLVIIATREKALSGIVDFLIRSLSIPISMDQRIEIINSYNGKIEVFLALWVWYSNRKLSQWSPGGRNDWIDLNHATYLRDNKEISFVTDDKLILEGFKAIWPGKALTPRDLINRFSN